MAASEEEKNKEQKDEKSQTVKKRSKAKIKAERAAKKKKDDGVARAPKAPTVAPNAPKKGEAKEDAQKRRVVDPKVAAEKERKKKEAARKKKEAEEKAAAAKKRAEEKARKEAEPDTGFTFGDSDATMDDFAAMLEGEGGKMPDQSLLDVGDTVNGTVVSIGERYVFVDIGRADEAIVDRAQYEDEEGNLELELGQSKDFYVIGFGDGIELGREMGAGDSGLDAIEAAHASGVPISGKVTGTNKGGFEVNIAGVDAFCPISHIELAYTEEPEVHVGNTYTFAVTEVREGGRTVVVSRTALLEKERESKRKETLESLEVGEEVDGVVTRVADFGAFVDIGGIEGLVHVSELSHIYFDKPTDVIAAGDNVTAQVLKIEEQEDGALRIGLSIKEAQQDPWMEVNDKFTVGQTVVGTIVRLAPFGAFVELTPGIEGLVHVSEISRNKHVATPGDVVDPGEKVSVEIQDIDLMRRRISLSMAATEDDPWATINERFAIGMEVEGVVANTEDFGAFIDLDDGITALLPRSEMNLPSEVTPHRKYKRAEKVTARILNIEPERRRMALTLKEASDIGAEAVEGSKKTPGRPAGSRSYSDEEITKKGTFGTLGDLLKERDNED